MIYCWFKLLITCVTYYIIDIEPSKVQWDILTDNIDKCMGVQTICLSRRKQNNVGDLL